MASTARTLLLLFTSILLLLTIFCFPTPSHYSSLIHFHGLERVLSWLQYERNSSTGVESFTTEPHSSYQDLEPHYAAKDHHSLGDFPQPAAYNIVSQTLRNSHYSSETHSSNDEKYSSQENLEAPLILNILESNKEVQSFKVISSSKELHSNYNGTSVYFNESEAGTPETIQETQGVLEVNRDFGSSKIMADSVIVVNDNGVSLSPSYAQSDEISDTPNEKSDQSPVIPFKETELIALSKKNFSNFVTERKYVAVHFYLSWSNWSYVQALEYAAAATMLESKVVFAKVDASVEKELARAHKFVGCSTMYFFIDGVPSHTYRHCCKRDAVVSFLNEKMKGGVHNITKPSQARDILKTDSMIILALIDNLEGPDSEEFSAAPSKLGDTVIFYRTASKYIPTIFHIDPEVKRPALFMLRKDAETSIQFDGPFTRSAMADFVSENKFPLVTTFNGHNALSILKNKMQQLWLFANKNETEKVMPTFKEAADVFNGKLLFVYIKRDHKHIARQLSYAFHNIENDPEVIAYSGHEASLKCIMNSELSLSNVK